MPSAAGNAIEGVVTHPMNPRRIFRPDVNDCVLEDRLAPAIANLGVIVLTTGGYMLLTPFPVLLSPPPR